MLRRRPRPMRWSVVVAAPKGEAGEQWGDTWFARDLVDALQRAGEQARVVSRAGATAPAREEDDVVVVLRGLRRVVPRRGKATWLLWVISHPELVETDEPGQYDAVFAASAHWQRAQSEEFGVPVTPLLQATNPHRFRPAARAKVEAGLDLDVYGVGWEQFLAPERIRGQFLANADLPAAYASAGVVLNDHWPDMAREGFLSNRLFDAGACGARVLTDRATGLAEVFGDGVRTYDDGHELVEVLCRPRDEAFPDRAARLALADRIARDHGFDARAATLIERARDLRR